MTTAHRYACAGGLFKNSRDMIFSKYLDNVEMFLGNNNFSKDDANLLFSSSFTVEST